jgi:alkanesulfonate monooxygenase SsuD/methylene tetrahydromethanopterin reductase-like flavin-dependent oxidoreductase (luciferase family)
MSTKTLRLGTGICLLNQRDPIQTAKLVTSIDQLSTGRCCLVSAMVGTKIGNGWHEEMRNYGTVLVHPRFWCVRREAHRTDVPPTYA